MFFHTDVQLARAHFEPATATRAKRLRFFNFFKSQQAAKEVPRSGLASFWGGNLYVINS